MMTDARADFAMFCSLAFLISVGGGAWSLDVRRSSGNNPGRRNETL